SNFAVLTQALNALAVTKNLFHRTGGTMATSSLPRAASRGRSFLVESCTPEEVFSPAELTDDQKLIGQTAEEFIRTQVAPAIPDLEQHKPGLLPELLKKAGEIGLLGG